MSIEFIAEVSSNHNKDIARCIKFIETAKDIGCDGIKFQLFRIDKLFAPEVLEKSQELRKRCRWELPLELIPELAQRSRELGLKFACTPFYLDAIEVLRPYVDFYKVASYEILWRELLKSCSLTGLPIVLSTGMATLDEIDRAVEIVRSGGSRDITLLHCVSSYPVAIEQCNLAAIETLRDRYGCKVGWSDHSVSEQVIYRAVYGWQASMIEFHLDLDGMGDEFETGHCWLPDKIASVINNIRKGANKNKSDTSADGNGSKEPAESEVDDRNWRADPSDGLRPLLEIRKSWKKK